ncbi:MAG: ATP-binding protein [Firmicutes bacterium]|nr:ATP-binding protein [Bacillota bacterium]
MPDSSQLMEAFQAFTAASEQLQKRYEALQEQLGRLRSELETVIEAVPFGLWVLGDEGELRFTNRPEGLEGAFLDGPPPWEASAPTGLRHFKDHQGRERFFEQESRLIEPRAGRIVTLRDITEAHLKAQQDSREERLQAMGLMAAELAHEIRNPLGSLALFSGMLVEDLNAQPTQLELAQRIQEGVQRLNALVSNTLTFSRDLHPKVTRLELASFWEDVKGGAGLGEGIAWVNELPTDASWNADPDLMRQVAANLLQNARRALEDRPAPRIALTGTLESIDGTAHWHIVLEDNGCGVKPETLARIFDPFFSTFGGGTGLGLAVSHRIMVAHGGLLHLESTVSQGTKVHLRLPAAR